VPQDDAAELSDLLLRVARAQRHAWRDALAPWRLTPSQGRALRVVTARDGIRVSDLAEALRITPRSATEVADDLEKQGLIERLPDSRDRRAVLLRPTDAGRRLREDVDVARAADARRLFARLSGEDRTTLARILRQLTD
jgi:DNA-binding MarR family transcriptional regulator